MFPEHKCGLFLTHNEHRNYYQTLAQYLEDHKEQYDWESEEALQRALQGDELWTLQWYPNTPIGFCAVAATTLEDVLRLAEELK